MVSPNSIANSEDRVLRAVENYYKVSGSSKPEAYKIRSEEDGLNGGALDEPAIMAANERGTSQPVTSEDVDTLSSNNAELNVLGQQLLPRLLRMQKGLLGDLDRHKRMGGGLRWRLRALEARLKEKDSLIKELSDYVKELSDGRDSVVMRMRKEVVRLQQEVENRRGAQRGPSMERNTVQLCLNITEEWVWSLSYRLSSFSSCQLQNLASTPEEEFTDSTLADIRNAARALDRQLR
ncbi:hypothetical protein FOZ62_026958 [Perkinsus olseni]|uniref:Uncharacterized protein n=1 Tax=Perkinsus olseni TaxID=32597 RepID=A0A7J6RNH8_PEROL|nr:hypothetical protein FOZ62_026958 [Perkinsus olseni]